MKRRPAQRHALLLLIALLLTSTALPLPAAERGRRIDWRGLLPPADPAAWQAAGFRTARFADQLLPLQLQQLTLPADRRLTLAAVVHSSRPLPDSTLLPAAGQHALQPDLPTAPIWILSESRAAAQRYVVVALTPLFVVDGVLHHADQISAELAEQPGRPAARLRVSAPHPLSGVRIVVSQSGIQQISAAALLNAGLDLSSVPTERLQLQSRHGPLAFELLGSGNNRRLRFYAPPPGDRWNTTDTYWLKLAAESPAHARITTRDVSADPALPPVSHVYEAITWQQPQRYVSTDAGLDGDHWFSTELNAVAGAVLTDARMTLNSNLPAAAGPLTVTISGSLPAAVALPAAFTVNLAGVSRTVTLTASGAFSTTAAFPAGAGAPLQLSPVARSAPLQLLIDAVTVNQPAALDVSAGNARFSGAASPATYQLSSVPAGSELFDISDPHQPQRLIGWSDRFSDAQSARSYLLSSQAATPAVSAVTAVDLTSAQAVDAIYIAPQALLADLAPLLSQRRSQGYRVAAVAAEAIYDHWSAGQIDPEAIRSFLAFTAEAWPTAPRAVTLVGDGSVDPRRYNPAVPATLLPPYLADVDPWLGETACETCFVRFDSSDPRDDPLPDLQLGRLPVKSAAELRTLVTKLLAYERTADAAAWRGRVLFVADDADSAGDFAVSARRAAAALPAGLQSSVAAYSPALPAADDFSDPLRARANIAAQWRAGAGLLVYHGHAAPQQWASNRAVAADGSVSYQPLLQIYDDLSTTQLPVVLALTCLTAAFQTPYLSGMTLDEWLLLNPAGGSAAVWGSSGLGVAFGHQSLQDGFLAALSAADPNPPIGDLVDAGLRQLFSDSVCCRQALFHQLLLGDPLTPLQLTALQTLLLPAVTR
jgi:hypothetical protein